MRLPSGWRVRRLDEIALVERGRFSARPRNDPKYYGGSIPFVQTGDITASGGTLRRFSQTLNPTGLSVSKLFPKGTILVTIAANIGDVALATFDVACPDSVVAVQAREACTEWLAYALSMRKQDLDRVSTQNAQKNVNLQVLRPMKILCPPLLEQRKIAEILGTWDEAIGLLERRIAAARERKKGLMQHLLTGQVRFPGFTEPWREVRLGDVFRQVRRTATPPITHVLSISAGVGFESQESKFSRVIAGKSLARYTLLKAGEYAYNRGNSKTYPQGCIYRLGGFAEAAVPNVYYCFRAASRTVLPDFYAHYFESGALGSQLRRSINTGVRNDGLLNVSLRDFLSCRIPVPPIAEQKAIARVLCVQNVELAHLVRKLSALQAQKRGLMQRLLTGQVRVTALLEADLEQAVPIHRELAGLGWVPETADVSQRIVNICDFLGIESLAETPTLRRAARQTRTREPHRIAEIAWGKRVERLARHQRVGEYRPEALREAIPNLLRCACEPTDVAHVPGILAKYGVHFVILRHLDQTYLDGALLYTDERPIIALTLRHKQLDRFWFTLMHELAHLLLGHEGIYLDTIDEPSDPTEDEEEREANRQAEDWLIDRAAIKRLGQNRYLSYADVARFAQERGLHPSIVAGRIRHERGDHRLFHDFDVTISSYLEPWRDQEGSPADVGSG